MSSQPNITRADGPKINRPLFAFDVWVAGTDWHQTINARTAGQAKSEYYSSLNDVWPNIPFTWMRAIKLGPPHTSSEFVRNAIYRGFERGAVKCGDRVRVGDGVGVIVGHNSSANFNVLFDDDSPRHSGLRLNVHPHSIVFLKEEAK